MGVEKQVILLQVGAEVDQSAFNKAASVVESSAKKIDKSLISVEQTSDATGKKLEATFGNKATKTKIEALVNDIRELSKAYKLGDTSSIDKFEKSVVGLLGKFGKVKQEAIATKKAIEEMFAEDMKISAVKGAVGHYTSGPAGSDKGVGRAQTQQIAGFINALTATGNKLRSFDAKKYAN